MISVIDEVIGSLLIDMDIGAFNLSYESFTAINHIIAAEGGIELNNVSYPSIHSVNVKHFNHTMEPNGKKTLAASSLSHNFPNYFQTK